MSGGAENNKDPKSNYLSVLFVGKQLWGSPRNPLRKLSLDSFLLALIAVLFLSLLPWAHVLSTEPSTGGDTASHFLPLENILKQKTLRPWNAGNLAGEPQLVHYFPMSFILMAFFSLLLPAGFVFNWLCVLPTFLLPFSVYWGLKKIRAPEYVPILAAALCVPFILNTSYSAWGGNLLSTLAGQFAHAYALVFFFLFIATLQEDFDRDRFPLRSGVLAACVVLSHAYIALALPVACIAFLFVQESHFWKHMRQVLIAGLVAFVLSVWWIVPSLQSNAWTTPYASSWLDNLTLSSYLPKFFYPYVGAIPLILVSLFSNSKGRKMLSGVAGRQAIFWLVLAAFYTHLVWAFPLMGLVDIRAIPQVQLFVFIVVGYLLASFVKILPKKSVAFFIFAFVAAITLHSNTLRKTGVRWLNWNWSGWSSKTVYPDFKALNEHLRGDFNEPRVAFEHSAIQNKVGTVRAFEMLPYFSGRATTESLYMQATVFAPAAFYLQSLIGESRSCPFPNLPCGFLDLNSASRYFSLLGVGDLILSSKPAIDMAKSMPEKFQITQKFGPWTHVKILEDVSLVEAFHSTPVISDHLVRDWKADSIKRLLSYQKNEPWVVNQNMLGVETLNQLKTAKYPAPGDCQPKLNVNGGELLLATNCVGVPHVLKMSFNPSFRSNNQDNIFPVYPGYIGIIPSKAEVLVKFAATSLWKFFDVISSIAWLAVAVFWVIGFVKQRELQRAKEKI